MLFPSLLSISYPSQRNEDGMLLSPGIAIQRTRISTVSPATAQLMSLAPVSSALHDPRPSRVLRLQVPSGFLIVRTSARKGNEGVTDESVMPARFPLLAVPPPGVESGSTST